MRQGIQNFNTALSDNVPRRAAFYAKAEQHRKLIDRIEGTNTKLDDFLEELRKAAEDPVRGNARLRQLHDDVVQEVLDELIDFNDLSQFERAAIRRVVPFYSWIKGITKATARLALNRPLKAAFLTEVAQTIGEKELQKLLGIGEDILKAYAPAGGVKKTPQGRVGRFVGTQG